MSGTPIKVTITIQIGDLEVSVRADSVKPVANPADFLGLVHQILKGINEELA